MDAYVVDCANCGRYSLTGSLGASLKSYPENVRRAVSWLSRERSESDEPILELNTHNIEEIASVTLLNKAW